MCYGLCQNAFEIFGGDVKKHIVLFAGKKAEDFTTIHDSFSTSAKNFKGKVLFVLVDNDVEDNARIAEFFGIDSKEVPTVRMIDMEADEMTKYKPETKELTTDNIKVFIQDVLDGKIKVPLEHCQISSFALLISGLAPADLLPVKS